MNPSLRKNSNYPPMSDTQWADASFNRNDPPEKEFDVLVSYSISKEAHITSDNYDESGMYGEGELINPLEEYKTDYITLPNIIIFAKICAEYMLNEKDYSIGTKHYLKNILDSCNDWTVDEEVAEQI